MTIELETSDIQGNILMGYKFPCVAHVFGVIDDNNVDEWRAFLKQISALVTPARWTDKPAVTLNVGLSYRAIAKLRPALAREVSTRFGAFADGMPTRSAELGDGDDFPRKRWDERHVWLSLHAQAAADLDPWVARLKQLGGRLDLLEEQPRGAAQIVDGHWYEHFGYRDDISYPAIEGTPLLDPAEVPGRGKLQGGKWLPIATGEFLLGYPDENGADALSGLSPDAQRLLKHGTFGVFRRLRQDVVAFRKYLSEKSGPHATPEYLASRMMGRDYAGSPLAGSPESLANFTYEGDAEGARCPLGAHIRRANPRSTEPGESGRHRLLRRGMSYGSPLAQGAEDNADRGLWFVAFNASIEQQFEFIQKQWLNSEVGTLSDARDPIVGAGSTRAIVIEGDSSTSRAPILLLDIPQFVTCQGGQYYFMPGLGGLALLYTDPPLSNPPPSNLHEAP